MIATFQALAVALIAITPGATYTFAYERQAGAYGANLSDRLIRFLVASGFFHAAYAWLEFDVVKRVVEDGHGWVAGWHVGIAAVVYFVLPYVVGSVLGWAAQKNKAWVRWLVGRSRYPRAWDYLWSRDRPLIVRIKLGTGDHLAGIFELSDDATGIASYAAGYGEDADLYLSRQLRVDPHTGAFEVDERGVPRLYDPPVGLMIRASDVESWSIQEVENV